LTGLHCRLAKGVILCSSSRETGYFRDSKGTEQSRAQELNSGPLRTNPASGNSRGLGELQITRSAPKTSWPHPYAGFSISCGVDGLNTKVGGGRSECHRQEPLGGSKFQNLEG